MSDESDSPLTGFTSLLGDVTVVELDGEFCPYAGRLLVDLGAKVTRVRRAECGHDVWWPLHRGKAEFVVDPERPADRRRLLEVIDDCDVLVQSAGPDERDWLGIEPTVVHESRPRMIHAVLTPYGLYGPNAGFPSTELTRLAAGGLLWLGGYPDAEPVAPYGDQSAQSTAIFGVVAILLMLIERSRTGAGGLIEVSAQEAMTQALETSLSEFELTGAVRHRAGSAPREAGTGIYPCADGFVSMVAGRLGTARAWGQLREWLIETATPGADQLRAPSWDTLEFRQRPDSIKRFEEIFTAFTRTRTKQHLYLEAQHRNIALAPVNAPREVLADPQLTARAAFVGATDPLNGKPVKVPRSPFRIRLAGDEAAAK